MNFLWNHLIDPIDIGLIVNVLVFQLLIKHTYK